MASNQITYPARDKAVKYSSRKALELLFSLEPEELEYLLLKEVPKGVFEALTEMTQDDSPKEELSQATDFYSGLQPHIYVSDALTDSKASSQVSQTLWLLVQELYRNPELDKADLNAWAEDVFPFVLKRVSRAFILKYQNYSRVYSLTPKLATGYPLALASFAPLN